MIWIIGGTKDSRDILEKLILNTKKDIIVSTATEYGGKLLEDYIKNNRNRKIKVISERLKKSTFGAKAPSSKKVLTKILDLF